MNSNLLLIAFLILLSTACNIKEKEKTDTDKIIIENVDAPFENTPKGKKITDRDYSINLENSYNDIFIDSMAMEKYISSHQLADKKIALRIRSFYNARNYQFAWFTSKGLTEQTRFFWNQYDYAVTHLKDTSITNNLFFKKAEFYINQEQIKVNSKDSNIINTELGFTEHFIRYINSTYEKGYVKRKEQEKFIPIKKADPLIMADSLINKKHKDEKYYEDVNEMYAGLKKNLAIYYELAQKGGWPILPTIKTSLKIGVSDTIIAAIKNRLRMTSDFAGNDTSLFFNDTLEIAIKKFQKRHGYKPDGIITPGLIKDMNVPVSKRLMEILINMDRMRWMPQKPKGNWINVNIPEFILHVMDGNKKVFDMIVVVGRVGNNTMMFNGDLNQIVFSPYWNVPPSIIEKEILPAMKKNPGYLPRKNMEQIGGAIRQKPGPGNALGKVKFIFPNSFNMYFHDTPSKSLFGLDKRAFSHGCIRLSEPQKMAEWLLRNDSNWNKQKIVTAMNQTNEKSVKLKEAIPVFIIYYTAWVDEDGLLNFRDDVYQHDKDLIQKMFVPELKSAIKVVKLDNLKVHH